MADLYSGAGGGAGAMAVARGNMEDPRGGKGPQGAGDGLDVTGYGTREVLVRLVGYVRPHAVLFVLAFVANVVSVLLQLYVPILIGRGIDRILGTGSVDFQGLAPIVVQLLVVVAGAVSTQWVAGYCTNRLSYKTVCDLRKEACDAFFMLPFSFLDSHAHGDLLRYSAIRSPCD